MTSDLAVRGDLLRHLLVQRPRMAPRCLRRAGMTVMQRRRIGDAASYSAVGANDRKLRLCRAQRRWQHIGRCRQGRKDLVPISAVHSRRNAGAFSTAPVSCAAAEAVPRLCDTPFLTARCTGAAAIEPGASSESVPLLASPKALSKSPRRIAFTPNRRGSCCSSTVARRRRIESAFARGIERLRRARIVGMENIFGTVRPGLRVRRHRHNLTGGHVARHKCNSLRMTSTHP